MSSISRRGVGYDPLDGFEIDGAEIRFLMAGIPGDPTFEGALSGEAIQGAFTQGGMAFPFIVSGSPRGLSRRPLPARQRECTSILSAGIRCRCRPDGALPPQTAWPFSRTPRAGSGWVSWCSKTPRLRWRWPTPGAFSIRRLTGSRTRSLRLPLLPEFERSLLYNYEGDDWLYQAAVLVYDGDIYILLIDAELAAYQPEGRPSPNRRDGS